MTIDLTVLADKRNSLLLAEMAAWLHMFGKFHPDFLRGNHNLDIQIPPDLKQDFPILYDLLTDDWTGKIWDRLGIPELQASSLSIFDLIKEHRNRNAPTGLQRLMQDAHGRGSSTEKGVLNRFFPGQQKDVFLSTAAGDERLIDLQEVESQRRNLYQFLQSKLQGLKRELQRPNGNVDWSTFRGELIAQIEKAFRVSVAETRRPINDVTLFDQTATSVAFLKAALAQNLLRGWKDPQQSDVKKKYHWRILRVGLDGLQFWGKSAKLTDLLGRKESVKGALDAVQQLLEHDYPLGTEIYRDENGSLFIVPDVPNLLEAPLEKGTLQIRLQEIAQDELENEGQFTPELRPPTRNMLSFGQLVNKKLPPPSANPQALASIWQSLKDGERTDICTVCGVRPQGYAGNGQPLNQKALQRNVCGICERRRVDRASEWAGKLQTTVWTDEVSDVNGRLALIVGQFGLDHWLTGQAFNSVMAFDPSTRNLIDPGRSNAKYRFDYLQLLSEIQQALSSQKRNQTFGRWVPLLDNLLLRDTRGGLTKFPDIYNLYVGDTDLNQDTEQAHLFALSLMRQQPSPARIRRTWETNRNFWQEILPTDRDRNLFQSLVGQVLGLAGPRLEIRGALHSRRSRDTLGPYHAYELVLPRGVKLSVVWDKENQRFITAENLDYLSRNQQLGKAVQEVLRSGVVLTAEEAVGYGAKNKVWGTITIQDVQELPDRYIPAIPILTEPRTFVALVPAEKSLEVIKRIKEKYEREMGKVRNRLSLHLGCVYAHRRTPIRALLDAGRAMLGYQTEPQPWTVKEIQTSADDVALKLEYNGHQIQWCIPSKMGDGTTEDRWYPYFFVETEGDDSKADAGNRRTVKVTWPTDNGQKRDGWIVHVADLRSGEITYLWPSTFDFEFLDTTARRFEIHYDENGRRPRRTRPYYLEDLERLEKLWEHMKHLTKTQRHQVIRTIDTTREAWYGQDLDGRSTRDKVFKKFVADTLAGADWPKGQPWGDIPPEWRQKLIQAGVHGELTDLAELHMEILKE
ncbi:MAG: CRISPR-associated protein Csx11 [Candidatus Neomarinimicrobiota bacterium]|nr:MAG: CRISPR-associated protein Csx11 [Candidatus Neomarinimicrobiota bacterium]